MDEWKSFQGTLFEYYLLFTCSRLLPLPLLDDFYIQIVLGFCPFSFDQVSCLLCWVEPVMLFKQKSFKRRLGRGFKRKKLRNAVGLTSVSSYYGIQHCWKCLKETLYKKKKFSINWWGKSLCLLVSPLVDSHPSKHSVVIKPPVNKCRLSLTTS